MKPTTTILGPFEIFSVEAGRFWLDAGAMFGVVPWTLWSKRVETDAKNRLELATRCLLIKSSQSGRTYLVDNGCGDKFSEKMSAIYGIDHEHSDLLSSLEACGVSPEQVTDMIFSHLHFDHSGGTTYRGADGELKHRFPNALYHVSNSQMSTAVNPNAREKASFLSENIEPIAGSDRLRRVGEHHVWEKGLSSLPVFGHTEGMLLPVIQGGGKTLVFAADLIPTVHHLPLPWVMAYDMQALVTLREKKIFLDEAVAGGWHLFLEHDAGTEQITVGRDEKGTYVPETAGTLDDL